MAEHETTYDFLRSRLGAATGHALYVGVDPARAPDLRFTAEGLAEEGRCLYSGEALEEYEGSAPWIFRDDVDGTLSRHLVEKEIGRNAFVLFQTDLSFDDFHRRLRRFTKIRTTEGHVLFWKLFSPDSLGTFIPFMTREQRTHFFEGMTALAMEVADGQRRGLGVMRLRPDGVLATDLAMPGEGPEAPIGMSTGEIGDVNASMPPHLRIDTQGASTRPMMTFTVAQLEAPVLFNRPKLIAEVREHVMEEFGEVLRDVPPNLLLHHLNHGIGLAFGYGLNDVTAIKTFVDLMMRIAPGWHRQHEINQVLSRDDIAPDEKMRLVTAERYDRAWAEATTFDSADEWLGPEFRETA